MPQTKKHQIEGIIIRVLGEYGFDKESAETVSKRLTSEIYNLVPARVVSSAVGKPAVSAEVMMFKDITGYFPPAASRDEITALMHGKTVDELKDVYRQWCFKGNNPHSAVWLKWLRKDGQTNRVVVVS